MIDLTPAQAEFIECVCRLRPRVAAFDCDGTLWSGDAGEGFFSWTMKHGLVSSEMEHWARARYAEYRAGNVAEEVMCGEMVTMYRGTREADIQKATDEYFELGIAPGIFPEMRELVRRLLAGGTDVWAVSSSNEWIIRSGMKQFGIRQDRILATTAAVENGVIANRLIRIPSGPGKPEALGQVLAVPPDCAFGNSIWDREMLAMARHPFAINPSSKLKEIAAANRWTTYQPTPNGKVEELA